MSAPLLTAEQAAARLGLARPRTVLELARRGELGHVRVGRRAVRFREADLEAYIAARWSPPRAGLALELTPARIPGVVPPNPRRRRT